MSKKRIRDMTWEDYGISKALHRELKAFCEQYEEKKSKINYGAKSINYDGMPHGSTSGNPTESMAMANYVYQRDCEMIEQAAIATHAGIYQYLIKSVINDLAFEYIEYDKDLGRIPICRNDFYGYRRLFFYNLTKIKVEYNSR